MHNLKALKTDIDALRTTLYALIKKKQGNMLDSEIISISQQLDILINKYNNLIKSLRNR